MHIRPAARETDLIYQRLSKTSEGDVVTYSELSAMIGRDITTCRGYLATARRQVLREHGMVFAPVTGVGVRHCNDIEKVGLGMDLERQARRRNNKAIKTTIAVKDYDALPPEVKDQHQRTLIRARMIQMFTKKSRINEIAQQTEQSAIGPTNKALVKLMIESEIKG